MTLLEKIKVNLDYLLGKADPELYAKPYKYSNISSEEWQKRWDIFSDNGNAFIWYGVDSEGNIAQFACDLGYVPEAFFQDKPINQQIYNFFKNYREITTTQMPENLRPEVKQLADGLLRKNLNDFWGTGANKGYFIFREAGDLTWYNSSYYWEWINQKPPYELLLMPSKGLKVFDLPDEIQKLLEPYHFENLKFEDCQFLDVSNYLYCEN